ncbi:MAG: hypothetical protein WA261_15390 [Candidatus Sulfotelmatobacter sp.]
MPRGLIPQIDHSLNCWALDGLSCVPFQGRWKKADNLDDESAAQRVQSRYYDT